MAWHSGKPADSDFLSASVQHIRENFAELEPLQPRVAELVDLTTLHPHIAALLNSRIVEMGSNANGAYVRWENGLQIVWATRSDEISGGTFTNLGSISLPAAFVDTTYAIIAGYNNAGYRLVFSRWSKTATLFTPQIYNFDGAVTAIWWYAAIGRWV